MSVKHLIRSRPKNQAPPREHTDGEIKYVIRDCDDPDANLRVTVNTGRIRVAVFDRGIILNAEESDMGNADRLVGLFGNVIRYCSPIKRWLYYDKGIWHMDAATRLQELAQVTARATVLAVRVLRNRYWNKLGRRAEKLGLGMWLEPMGLLRGKDMVPPEEWLTQLVVREPKHQKSVAITLGVLRTSWNAERLESSAGISAMLKMAESHRDVVVEPDELDADNYILNVRNGVLLLRTGKLVAHHPRFLCTKQAPVDYDPEAKSPLFDMLLTDCTRTEAGEQRPDLRAFLLRLYGMTLTGDVSEQYLPIAHGQGNNGKSQLNESVAGVMGDYAGLAAPDLLVAKKFSAHPTEVADLRGRRFVVASETEKGAELRVQFVKWITGNDKLKGRYMRCDFFEFPRTHKTVIETNNRPVITEQTHAIWRRVLLIPFDYRVPASKIIKGLAKKILNEEPEGVLARLVDGCLAWQHEGLNPPLAVKLATVQYRDESDIAKQFIKDEGVEFDKGLSTSDALAARLAIWNLGREGHHKLSRDDLYKALRAGGGKKERRRLQRDGKKEKKPVWCWVNVHLPSEGGSS